MINIESILRTKESAFALVLALFAVVILSLLGIGLLGLGLHTRIFAVRTAQDIQARCAADAGLARAVFQMNEKLNNKPWSEASLPAAIDESLLGSDVLYSYTVSGSSAAGYTVESVGKSGPAIRKVVSSLSLESPFDFAIFAEDGIDLKYGTHIDWYNYTQDDENLKVGTNSTASGSITLKRNATINGDVYVGSGGDPDTVISSNGGKITGKTAALTEQKHLPSVTVPDWVQSLPYKGNITGSKTITTSGRYGKINLKNGKVLTIDGLVTLYVSGDVILKNSAELQIVDQQTNPNASLALYLGGKFEGKNGGSINNRSEKPNKLKIYGQQILWCNLCTKC